jgi:hypothetical protein
VLVVTASLVVTLPAAFRFAIFPQDEGLLLAYPDQLLHGSIPNLDFQSVYGPVNPLVIALAFKVGGHSLVVERLVGVVYRLVLALSLTAIVWRIRGAVVALAAGIVSVLMMAGALGLAAYAWFAGLAFSAVALLLLSIEFLQTDTRRRTWRLTVAGVCLGLAMGSRLDFLLAVILLTAAMIITNRRMLPAFAVGLFLGLIPMYVNIALAGFSNVMSGELIQPIFVSGPGRKIAFSALSGHEQAILILCLLTALGLIARGTIGFVRRREQDSAYLLCIGAFELGILPEAFERTDSIHLALVSCFILPTLLIVVVPTVARTWHLMWQCLLVTGATALLLIIGWPNAGSIYTSSVTTWTSLPIYELSHSGRMVLVGSQADQKSLRSLLRAVDHHSHPGDRVFIGPSDLRTANYNDTYLYFLLPRLTPGTFYLEMDPGVANARNSRLAHEISGDQIVILDKRDSALAVDTDSRTRYGPKLPNVIVRTQFRPVGTWGPWTLYIHR